MRGIRHYLFVPARGGAIAVAALLLSAQTSPPPKAPDLLVTGQRLSEKEAREQAVAYVRRTGVAMGERPVARWIAAIWPHVAGLDDKLALMVQDRIRTAAVLVGAPVLPSNNDTTFLSLPGNSMVSTQTARTLHTATVLVDVTRTSAVTLNAVADDVAFVALAEIHPSDEPPPISILGLFNPGAHPDRLTDWDRRGRQQRGRLTTAPIGDPRPAP